MLLPMVMGLWAAVTAMVMNAKSHCALIPNVRKKVKQQ